MNATNLTGIIRSIDDLGCIIIPKEMRRALGVYEGEQMEIFTTSDGEIILRKATVKEVDGVTVKVENKVSVTPAPAPAEPKLYYFENDYDANDRTIIKVTPEQDKLLDFLYEKDLINVDYSINKGLPEMEVNDLT